MTCLMKLHTILPAFSLLLTVLAVGLTSIVRRWSASTLVALLVLLCALVGGLADFAALRIHNLPHLELAFRVAFAGECLAAAAVLLFSVLYSRVQPASRFFEMGIPLTIAGLGFVFFVTSLFLDNHLFRLLPLPQTRSVLLISEPGLSAVSLFLIGTLLFSLYQMSRTYLAAGTMERWNIKYPLIGVSLWSFSLILVHANQLVNSGFDRSFLLLEHIGILSMDVLFLYAFLVQKTEEVALSLTRSTVNRSVLILLGGAGLLVLGGIGTTLGTLGPVWGKLSSSLTLFLGLGAFVVVFSSERLRRELESFLGVHVYSNRYDYRNAWMTLTRALSDSGRPGDIIPTLMETTREMTLSPSLSFATITESNEPVLHLQETLGWKADRNNRKQTIDPGWIPLLNRGLPLHSSDKPDTLQPGNEKPLFFDTLFKSLNASWIVPLLYQDRLLGLLGLNIKTRGALTVREDRLFLQALGAQWSSLLANASLSREMAGKREAEFLSSLRAFTFHDLKNAGVALKLLVHNAQKNIDSPEFQQELLFCLQNISEQIDSSMSQLLSPFQQEYSKTLNFDPVILIQNTVRSLNWDNLPGLAVKLSLSETPHVTGNPRVLETTLRNLLINAREALLDTGEILIETRTESDRLILVVSDNGPGMSREFIETRLFRPFQTTKKKGTGLGLFSCKLLIEQSGGTIDVHSREGEGTEFRITLPYAST